MVRFVLLTLNALAIVFLIFRLLRIYGQPFPKARKWITFAGGIVLLCLPVAMIFGFLKPTPAYHVMYPIGIFLFVSMYRFPE